MIPASAIPPPPDSRDWLAARDEAEHTARMSTAAPRSTDARAHRRHRNDSPHHAGDCHPEAGSTARVNRSISQRLRCYQRHQRRSGAAGATAAATSSVQIHSLQSAIPSRQTRVSDGAQASEFPGAENGPAPLAAEAKV